MTNALALRENRPSISAEQVLLLLLVSALIWYVMKKPQIGHYNNLESWDITV